MRIGVIGGTGLYQLPEVGSSNQRVLMVQTKYGQVEVVTASISGKEIVFLPRHGKGHNLAPHRINYKANIAALKKLGVRAIFATAACGALRPDYVLGDLLILDQFVDLTRRRPLSFFEGSPHVVHVDMTQPYCPRLRQLLIESARAVGIRVHERGCYFCGEGPRYETAAEVQVYEKLGGDVVGMTSATEAILAREAELCYAAVAIVTNLAAGISATPLTHTEVVEVMNLTLPTVVKVFIATFERYNDDDCACRHALDSYDGVEVKV